MLFTKPSNLNGAELTAELAAEGVIVDRIIVEADGKLNIAIEQKNVEIVEKVLAKHNGNVVAPELTISQKLESVGLSIDDLKIALGL